MIIPRYKKIILTLFLLAFLPRVVVLGLLLQNHFNFLSIDAPSYIIPVYNILHYGIFSQGSDAVHLIPDSMRTPLYPFFLLPFLAVGTPLATIAFVQDILFAISVILVYVMGQKIFHEKTARVAAMVMALEPFGFFDTNFITAQNIYYPIFIPAILLILYYLQNKDETPLYWSSGLFGIAALIKPVVIALFPFVVVAIILKRVSWQKKIRTGAVAFIIFVCVISPWVVRNKISVGIWQFSSTSDINLYNSNVLLFRNFFHISDSPMVDKRFDALSQNVGPEATQALGEAAKIFIKKHLVKYFVFHVLFAPRIFVMDQYLDVIQMFYHTPLIPITADLYGKLAHGDLRTFGIDFFILLQSPFFLVSLVGKMIWIWFLFLAIQSFVIALHYEQRYEKKSIIIFSFLFLCWYAIVFSPVGRAGYRIPIEFLIFLVGFEYFFSPRKEDINVINVTYR